MDDKSQQPAGAETGEAVLLDPGERPMQGDGAEAAVTESVEQPAKVMRIGSMVKQLLDEVHSRWRPGPSSRRCASAASPPDRGPPTTW
jgi:hypothetical protein